MRRIRFEDTRERYEIDNTSPAVLRDPNKCILCGDCVRVCEEMQGMGILNFAYRGSSAQVMPAFDRKLGADQLRQLRPVRRRVPHRRDHGEEPDRPRRGARMHDPKKRVVIQIAPAVRVARGRGVRPAPPAKTSSTSSSRRSSSWARTRSTTRPSAQT